MSMKYVTCGDVVWLLGASKGGRAFRVKSRLLGLASRSLGDLVPAHLCCLLPPLALFTLVHPDCVILTIAHLTEVSLCAKHSVK